MTIWKRLIPGAVIGVLLWAEDPAVALPILDCDQPMMSNNEEFFAVPGRNGTTTQVYRWIWPTRVEKIWEKAGWHCDGFLSNDGEYLVAGNDGSGQIGRDYKWDQVMLSFYHRDTLIRGVPLREVLLDPRKIAWNDCSSMWAASMGFMGEHRFGVHTADDRLLIYDVSTGSVVEVRPSRAYEEQHHTGQADAKRNAPPPETPPPKNRTWAMVDAEHPIYSKNRRFYVLPAEGRTVTQVFRDLGRGQSRKVWEKAGWDDATNISNDGEYLVTGYPGRDVLDRHYSLDTVLVSFYRRSKLIRAVPVREIILSMRNLWEWPEGYEWGDYGGFVSAHRFAIDTVEHRRLTYDVTRGVVADIDFINVSRFSAWGPFRTASTRDGAEKRPSRPAAPKRAESQRAKEVQVVE